MGSSFTASWNAIPDNGYWICWDQFDNNQCDMPSWVPNGAYTTKLLENLSPGTYFWQVQLQTPTERIDADGGMWFRFTVGPPPGWSFGKTAPANGATTGSGSLTLSWGSVPLVAYEVC